MAWYNGKTKELTAVLDKWDDNDDTTSEEGGASQDSGQPESDRGDSMANIRSHQRESGEQSPLLRSRDIQGETPARDCMGRIVTKIGSKCKVTCSYRVRALFSRYYRRTTIIMTFVCFASNITYYGLIYGLPHTFQEIQPEDEGSTGHVSPGAGIFFAALMEVPGVFLAILRASTISRRSNMSFSFIMSAICLLLLVWAFFHGHMRTVGICCIFAVKMFIASGFIVTYLYLLECYPTYFRATGLAFCMVTGRIGALFCPFLYDGLVYSGAGYIYFFVVIAIIISIAAVLVCLLPFETKDAPLSDI